MDCLMRVRIKTKHMRIQSKHMRIKTKHMRIKSKHVWIQATLREMRRVTHLRGYIYI